MADQLGTDGSLGVNQSLISTSGRYKFLVQGDGNAVLYRISKEPGRDEPRWATGTQNNWDVERFVVQSDGNLCLYNHAARALWASWTNGKCSKPLLWLHNDGNLCLYDGSHGGSLGRVWMTNTKEDQIMSPPPVADAPVRATWENQAEVKALVLLLETNQEVQLAVELALSMIPVIGGLLSGLATIFWPQSESQPDLTWDVIEKGVATIAGELIDRNNTQLRLDGLQALIKLYIDADKDTKQKSDFFDELISWFAENKAYYFKSTAPWLTMPYFVSVGTLQLTTLREQAFSWQEIFGTPDPHPDKRLKILQDAIDEYREGAKKIHEKCLAWRQSKVTQSDWTEWRDGGFWGQECTVQDSLLGISKKFKAWYYGSGGIHADDPKGTAYVASDAAAMYQELLAWVDIIYRQQLDDVLAPRQQWSNFAIRDPTQQPVVQRSVIKTGGIWGTGVTAGMLSFNDRALAEKHGAITQIVLYSSDDRKHLVGLLVQYGGVNSDLRGKRSDNNQTLTIGTEESIVCVSGSVSPSGELRRLRFYIEPSQSIGVGDWEEQDNFRIGFATDGPSPSGAAETFRLLYLYGVSCESKGSVDRIGAVFMNKEVL